jgi:D-alanyl-D-alanine carboxypeptidase
MRNLKHALHVSKVVLAPLLAFGLATALVAPASASTGPSATNASARCRDHHDVQQALDELTATHGLPGVTLEVTGPACGRWIGTSGVANLETQQPMPRHPAYRIGSITKTFTATVVLQLVAERKVELDAPIERYLPGLIRQNGYDGRRITVRQLLQHTSGLPDYTETLADDLDSWRFRHAEPSELIAIALGMPPPDQPWHYSTTNYIVAGLLVEHVTGNSFDRELERRIIRPLHLRDTYWPGDEVTIRGIHPRGYYPVEENGSIVLKDFTELNPTWAGAGGAVISTNADLNRYFDALLSGRLLPRKELAEMRRTVEADPDRTWPGARYGLGLISTPLSCGGLSWGHAGTTPGFRAVSVRTDDGRRLSMVINAVPLTEAAEIAFQNVIDTALCEAH